MDKNNVDKFDISKFDKPYIPKIEKDVKKIKELFNKISNLNSHDILIFSSINNLSLNVLDENDNTLIHEVIILDKDEHLKLNFIKFLVQNGVNPDYPNKINKTPFHEACRLQLNNIIEYLISLNININYQDDNGYTPLHYLLIGNIQINKNTKKDFIQIKNINITQNNSDKIILIKKKLLNIIQKLMNDKHLPLLDTLKNSIYNMINEYDDSLIQNDMNNFVYNSVFTETNNYNGNLNVLNNIFEKNKKIIIDYVNKEFNNFNSINSEYLTIHKIDNPKISWTINKDSEFGLIKNYNSKYWIKEQIKNSINKIINYNNDYKIINNYKKSTPEMLSELYGIIFQKINFKFDNKYIRYSIYNKTLQFWLYSGHLIYNPPEKITSRTLAETLPRLPPGINNFLGFNFNSNAYSTETMVLNDTRLSDYDGREIVNFDRNENSVIFNDYFEPNLISYNNIKHINALDNASDIINLYESYFMSGPRKYKIFYSPEKFNAKFLSYDENLIFNMFNNIKKLSKMSSIILYLLCVPIELQYLNEININYFIWYFLDINYKRYKNYFDNDNNEYPDINDNLLDIYNKDNIIKYIYSTKKSDIINILNENILINIRKNVINKDNWFIDNNNICYNDYPYINNDEYYKKFFNVDKSSVLQSKRFIFNKNNHEELFLHHVIDFNINSIDKNIFKILNYEITTKMIIYMIFSYYAIFAPDIMYNINKNKLFDIILDNEIHKNVHYQNYKFYYNDETDNFVNKWIFKNNIEKNNFANKWYNIYINNVLNNRLLLGIWIYNMWCDLMCKFSNNNLECNIPYRLLLLVSSLSNNNNLNIDNFDKYIINIFKMQLIKYINNIINDKNNKYNFIYILYILLDDTLTMENFNDILNDVSLHFNNFKNNIYNNNNINPRLKNIINIVIQFTIKNNIIDEYTQHFKAYFVNKKQTLKNIVFNIIIDYYNSLIIKPHKQFFTDFIFIFYNNLNYIDLLDYNYCFNNNINIDENIINIPSYLFSYYNVNLDDNTDYKNKFIISQILGLNNLGLVDEVKITNSNLNNIYNIGKNYKLFNYEYFRNTSYIEFKNIYEHLINNVYDGDKYTYNPSYEWPGGGVVGPIPGGGGALIPGPNRSNYLWGNNMKSISNPITQPKKINEKENNFILLLPNKYQDNLHLRIPEKTFTFPPNNCNILNYHLFDNKNNKLVKNNFPLPLNYTYNVKLLYYPYYSFEPPRLDGSFRQEIDNMKFKNFYYNIYNDHFLTNVVQPNIRNPLADSNPIDPAILERFDESDRKIINYVNSLTIENSEMASGGLGRNKPYIYMQPGIRNINEKYNAGNISDNKTYNSINLNRTNIFTNDDTNDLKYYSEKDRPTIKKTFNTRQHGYYDFYEKHKIGYALQDKDTRFFEGLNYFNYNNPNNEYYDFYYNIETDELTEEASYIAPLNSLYINKLIFLINHYQNKIKSKYILYINVFNNILAGNIKEYNKLFTEYYPEIIKINNLLNYIIDLYNSSISNDKERIMIYNPSIIMNELNYINSLFYLYYYIYYPNKKYKLLKFNYELLNNNLLQYYNFFSENIDYDNFYNTDTVPNELILTGNMSINKEQYKINNYFKNDMLISNKYNVINSGLIVDKTDKLPPALSNILYIFYIRILIELIIYILEYINNNSDKENILYIDKELTELIKDKLIKSDTLIIKNYYLGLLIEEIIKDCVNIFIHNGLTYKYNKKLNPDLVKKLNLKIKNLNIDLNTNNSNDMLLNINNNNIVNIYDLIINKNTDNEFVLFSNDFSNNKLINDNYTININNKIIELLIINKSNPFITNNNNTFCINNILKMYYYEPLKKFKELNILFNDDSNINYIKLENLNNCDKILNNVKNTTKLNEIFDNISNNLYMDIKNKIQFTVELKNNILSNIKESFYLSSYLIFHYLSFKLLKTTPEFTIKDLNDLLQLINTNYINLFNIYLFDNINEYYNIEYIIAKSLLNNLNTELTEINNQINILEQYNNQIHIEYLKYDNTSELKKIKINLENKINNLNKIKQKKYSIKFTKNNINDDNNIMKNYNLINNNIVLMKNWITLFDQLHNNNYNLIILLLLFKQKELFENFNDDVTNINIIKNGFKHLSILCENYFNNNNKELTNTIYNIILYITKLTIGVNIEYILRKSLYIYFINANEDANIDNIYIKINYILTEKINNMEISYLDMLYNHICKSLVKNAIKNFNDLNEELDALEILQSFLNLLDNAPLITNDNVIIEIKKQIIAYFSTISFDLISYWYINIENILRFVINNYRCLETFYLLIN